MKTKNLLFLPALALLTGCMKSEVQAIKSAIESNGYKLAPGACTLSKDSIEGYKESECYALGSSMSAEFYTLKDGHAAVNAVAGNVQPHQEYYFRQIAAGKTWFLLKGDWSQQSRIDSLMDHVNKKLSE